MVFRRLLVIGLLALVSAAGVLSTTALADTTLRAPTNLSPAEVARATTAGGSADHGSAAADDRGGAPCLQRASCAGGALLAGATLLLFLPASGLSLPTPALAARVVAAPTRLRSTLLAGKLFRPPRAS